jgi:hypothetical protein
VTSRILTEIGAWLGPAERDKPVRSNIKLAKFVRAAPTAQNVVDIFRGRWASDLSQVLPGLQAGRINLFVGDPRPKYVLKNFASAAGDLAGQRILELGPLEGGHTYQLEKLGAEQIVAVEANTEAYLKCLLVKELYDLKRASFLYGDCVEFLRTDARRWNIIFCCGILYHMADPVDLIALMAARTDRMFVWTHYYDENSNVNRKAEPVMRGGEKYTYYRHVNSDRRLATYWGGNRNRSSFMSRKDIMRALRVNGFVNYDLHEDDPSHPNGPCVSMSVWR